LRNLQYNTILSAASGFCLGNIKQQEIAGSTEINDLAEQLPESRKQ